MYICSKPEDESSSEEEESEDSNESGSSDDSEDDYDDANKKKGVRGLIEIENPNRQVRKAAEKVSKIDLNAAGSSKPELSRREREELEKQRSQAHYQKLHAEGKTEQAQADLARLAIIKQHRAEAAARREAEKKGKFIHCLLILGSKINVVFYFFYLQKKKRRVKEPSLSLCRMNFFTNKLFKVYMQHCKIEFYPHFAHSFGINLT